jgi:hypothetical protein
MCHQLAGSDEKGNLYQTQSVSCQTFAPTICRKNLGKVKTNSFVTRWQDLMKRETYTNPGL